MTYFPSQCPIQGEPRVRPSSTTTSFVTKANQFHRNSAVQRRFEPLSASYQRPPSNRSSESHHPHRRKSKRPSATSSLWQVGISPCNGGESSYPRSRISRASVFPRTAPNPTNRHPIRPSTQFAQVPKHFHPSLAPRHKRNTSI